MNKKITWAYRILGIIPFLWSISVIIFHFYIVNTIGFQPTYNNPTHIDNDLIWKLGSYLIIFYVVSLYCLFIFIGLFVIHLIFRFKKKSQIDFKNIAISSIGLFLAIIVFIVHRLYDTLSWVFD